MSPRSDQGGQHDMSAEGRESCALAATKHGVYAFLRTGLLPGCKQCPLGKECDDYHQEHESCPVMARQMDGVTREITGEGHIKNVDHPLVVEYVKNTIVLALIDRAVGIDGPLVTYVGEEAKVPKKKGKPYKVKRVMHDLHPLLKLKTAYTKNLAALSEQLGLSPKARKMLGTFKPDENVPEASYEEIAGEESADDQEENNGASQGDDGQDGRAGASPGQGAGPAGEG